MFKLDLKKAEEPEIKLSTLWDHGESKGIPEKTPASLIVLKPLTVWITTNWKILKEMGIPDHFTCLLRNLYAGQEANQNQTWNNGLVQSWERSTSRQYITTLI